MTATTLTLSRLPDGRPEIFTSLQGEGPRMGLPRTFVRTSNCNLFCSWCDTDYTWRWDASHPHRRDTVYDRASRQAILPLEAVAEAVLAAGAPGVIFTGGEPLIQQGALLEIALLLRAARPDLAVEVETNGTITPSPELLEVVDLFAVSPKLATSGVPTRLALRGALHRLAGLPQAVFKFVVQDVAADLAEIEEVCARYGLPPGQVWLMPCASRPEELRAQGRAVAEAALARGYGYSPRLHIDLWGDEPGR